MRVVGGTLGGRRLNVGTDERIRPTSDRAREAIFNILVSLRLPADAQVLDLFSGSGALGIEALSRGAASATFVDSAAQACDAIHHNLASLDVTERATVVRRDALRFASETDTAFDLAFADPPYPFVAWPDLLSAVTADVLVCESNREIEPLGHHRWETHRVRTYGTPVVTVLVRNADVEDPEDPRG